MNFDQMRTTWTPTARQALLLLGSAVPANEPEWNKNVRYQLKDEDNERVSMDKLRYPIGQFIGVQEPTEDQRKKFIESIAKMPSKVRQAVEGLKLAQLNTPYRLGGWTVQQVVHHLADNDMNAYIRFKRALTEDRPMAGSYREDLWAELSDYSDAPIETSILLLDALHSRFTRLLVKLEATDFHKSFCSPTHGDMTLDIAVQRYSWHGCHHIAQITFLRERMGW